MILQVSVCPQGVSASGSGGVWACLLGGCRPRRSVCQQTPPDRHSPRQTPPRQTPPKTAIAADGTHPTGMHSCLKIKSHLCILYFLFADCLKGCDFNTEHVIAAPRVKQDLCLVTIPDNPKCEHNTTFPCQIEIQANCTSFCQVHLHFHKFNLDPCKQNLTEHDNVCSQVNRSVCIH